MKIENEIKKIESYMNEKGYRESYINSTKERLLYLLELYGYIPDTDRVKKDFKNKGKRFTTALSRAIHVYREYLQNNTTHIEQKNKRNNNIHNRNIKTYSLYFFEKGD